MTINNKPLSSNPQLILSYLNKMARFLSNKTTTLVLSHKKKLIFISIVMALLYIAKKKLRFVHIFFVMEKATKLINMLPLPSFPQYRKLNRYQQISLNPLCNEIITCMNVDQIKNNIKQKKADWAQLKHSILSGAILSITLYNIQSYYFCIQNKYQSDFLELNAIQTFQEMMSELRKKFVEEIPTLKQVINIILYNQIEQLNIRSNLTFQQFCEYFDILLQKVFSKKKIIEKPQNYSIQNHPYRDQQFFKKAKNYFVSPYEYVQVKAKNNPQLSEINQINDNQRDPSFFKKVKSIIGYVTPSLSTLSKIKLFPKPKYELSLQRYEWSHIAYVLCLKKSLKAKQWPNQQSQTLFKLIIKETQQMINSINFSTLLLNNAQYNMKILKNRFNLLFQKKQIETMTVAVSLSNIYKIIQQQILLSNNKRQKFYENQIMKSIKLTKIIENQSNPSPQNLLIKSNKPSILAIQQQKIMQKQQNDCQKQLENKSSSLIQVSKNKLNTKNLQTANRHLEQIYEANELAYLIKQFEIKYFNQRSGVLLQPMANSIENDGSNKKSSSRNQQDQMRKLLSMLGENQELNKVETPELKNQ